MFHTIRENVDFKFSDSYKEAKDIAAKLNIELKMPRICCNQINSSYIPS